MGNVRPKNSVYFTIQCTTEERDVLNTAAVEAGTNRNHFVRMWIARLAAKVKE